MIKPNSVQITVPPRLFCADWGTELQTYFLWNYGRWISYPPWMILACIENISSSTKYKTVSSLKVSAVITHPSQLTVEACSTGGSKLWSQLWGSKQPSPPGVGWSWADSFLSHTLYLQKKDTNTYLTRPLGGLNELIYGMHLEHCFKHSQH